MAAENHNDWYAGLNYDNRSHNNNINNYSIEEILNLSDNFGHHIAVYRNEYNSIDMLKQVICSKMELVHRSEEHTSEL